VRFFTTDSPSQWTLAAVPSLGDPRPSVPYDAPDNQSFLPKLQILNDWSRLLELRPRPARYPLPSLPLRAWPKTHWPIPPAYSIRTMLSLRPIQSFHPSMAGKMRQTICFVTGCADFGPLFPTRNSR